MKKNIGVFILLIVLLCSAYAEEETPIVIVLSLDDCYQRIEESSLAVLYAKLDIEELEKSINRDWWQQYIPDLGYSIKTEINYSEDMKKEQFHQLKLNQTLISDDVLDIINDTKNLSLKKDIILRTVQIGLRKSIRSYYYRIIENNDYLKKLETLKSEYELLLNSDFKLNSAFQIYYESKINLLLLNIEGRIAGSVSNINYFKTMLLSTLNYPLNNNVVLTGNLDDLEEMSFIDSYETAMENSLAIKKYTLQMYEQKQYRDKRLLGFLPQLKVNFEKEITEGFALGANILLNFTEWGSSDPGNFSVSMISSFDVYDNAADSTPAIISETITSADFDITLSYSLNQILTTAKDRDVLHVGIKKAELGIKEAIADITAQMTLNQGFIFENKIQLEISIETLPLYDQQIDLFINSDLINNLEDINLFISILNSKLNKIASIKYEKEYFIDVYNDFLANLDGAW